METVRDSATVFGGDVPRDQMLRVFQSGPALTLVVAPPGYGKSVLAVQMTKQRAFSHVLWASVRDADVSGEQALGYLAAAAGAGELAPVAGAAVDAPRAGTMPVLHRWLRERHGQPVCVVLDGCNTLEDPDPLLELAQVAQAECGAASGVVVTTRALVIGGAPPDPAHVWTVDARSLLFDVEEVRALAALVNGDESQAEVPVLFERFGGHPALTRLMLRHPGLDDQVAPPQDLLWHVQRLTSALPADWLPTLYAAALLTHGRLDTLAATLAAAGQRLDMTAVRYLSPLFLLAEERERPTRFRVHAVLRDVLLGQAAARLDAAMMARLRQQALLALEHESDFRGAYAVLIDACADEEVAAWCERAGDRLLRAVGPTLVMRCLDRLPPERLAGSPRLLLLRASSFRWQERAEESLAHARVAGQLAEALGDRPTQIAASLLSARVCFDMSRFGLARTILTELQRDTGHGLTEAQACLIGAYLSVIEAYGGNIRDAKEQMAGVRAGFDTLEPGSDEAAFVANCVAAIDGMTCGRWDAAASVLQRACDEGALSGLQRLYIESNLAVALLETGLPAEADELISGIADDLGADGPGYLAASVQETRSSVRYLLGDAESGRSAYAECRRIAQSVGDHFLMGGASVNAAMNARAFGLHHDAAAHARRALDAATRDERGLLLVRHSAEIEVAACQAALGEAGIARRSAEGIRGELEDSEALSLLLRVDLVLAELDRQEGRMSEAVARLAPHAAYLGTGSANRVTALYVRGFPGLLGVLASALGVGSIPIRLLRLIPHAILDDALGRADAFAHPADVAAVRVRLDAPADLAAPKPDAEHRVLVRLFGGFEVETPEGVVDSVHWRKRKSRAVLAMLAARQGQDLPREVIIDRLWPHMADEQAKRNFYVTWSIMKRGMVHGRPAEEAKPFVECRGGICRVTRLVRSDLDDFFEQIQRLRVAQAAGDARTVLEAARAVADIYRGELLPGDIYEDWFNEVRDRTKHDFCDAMLIGAHVAEAEGQLDVALALLRGAGVADPWREDVYQMTMRCQMTRGQRSSAIETYLACQSHLSEDLGIDPSAETTRLYQAALAMEDGCPVAAGPGGCAA